MDNHYNQSPPARLSFSITSTIVPSTIVADLSHPELDGCKVGQESDDIDEDIPDHAPDVMEGERSSIGLSDDEENQECDEQQADDLLEAHGTTPVLTLW